MKSPKVSNTTWHVGVLLEYGAAPFHFKEDAPKSYYIRLRTPETEEGARYRQRAADEAAQRIDGRPNLHSSSPHDAGIRELWGADLKRAIAHSKSRVQIGQTVIARIISTEPVESRYLSSGRNTFRNVWEVETPRYMEQRKHFARQINESYRGASQQGIHDPEGVALYLIHDGLERLARLRYTNTQDQRKFINRVRDTLRIPDQREALIKSITERIQHSAADQRRTPNQRNGPDPRNTADARFAPTRE